MNLWNKLNKGCVLLITIPLLILVALWLFTERVWGGSVKPSLDAQYKPTAEYLLEHPQPIPSFMGVAKPGSTIAASSHVQVFVYYKEHRDIVMWTRLFLNNQSLSAGDADPFSIPALPLDMAKPERKLTLFIDFPLNNRLTPGLHLFRIQIGSSFNDFLNPDPKLSYEWACRVE